MKTTVYKPHKSSLGLDANLLAMLIYVAPIVLALIPGINFVAWVIPIVILVLEKNSKLVKFHAATSIILMILSFVVSIILLIFALIAGSMTSIASIVIMMSEGYGLGGFFAFFGIILIYALLVIILIIYLAVTAFRYKQVELPLIGQLAAKLSGSSDKTASRKTTKKK